MNPAAGYKTSISSPIFLPINSDDPAFFGTSLNNEFLRLHELGFSCGDIIGFIREGFMSAFIPDNQKANYLMLLDDEVEKLPEPA